MYRRPMGRAVTRASVCRPDYPTLMPPGLHHREARWRLRWSGIYLHDRRRAESRAQEENDPDHGREAPLIDVTQAKRQRVLSSEVMEALPSSRVHSSLAQLIPGIQAASQDVGGTIVSAGTLSGHGTKGGDSRIMINGLSQGSTRNSGGGRTTPNVGAMQQTTIDYTSADASAPTGGVSVNMIPKEGGNTDHESSVHVVLCQEQLAGE